MYITPIRTKTNANNKQPSKIPFGRLGPNIAEIIQIGNGLKTLIPSMKKNNVTKQMLSFVYNHPDTLDLKTKIFYTKKLRGPITDNFLGEYKNPIAYYLNGEEFVTKSTRQILLKDPLNTTNNKFLIATKQPTLPSPLDDALTAIKISYKRLQKKDFHANRLLSKISRTENLLKAKQAEYETLKTAQLEIEETLNIQDPEIIEKLKSKQKPPKKADRKLSLEYIKNEKKMSAITQKILYYQRALNGLNKKK